MEKYLLQVLAVAAAWLLLPVVDGGAGIWQQTLKQKFEIVDSFDELRDWSANGVYVSDSTDPRSYQPSLLPSKLDGSSSLWGYWANKYPTAVVAGVNGAFVPGETVVNGFGAKWEYRRTWVLDGVTYLQLRDPVAGSVGSFSTGDTLTGLGSGATAVITGWPKIIANHGSNNWRGSGKSLLMNLGDNDDGDGAMAGIGAQRLGTYFGDGTTKGRYRKVHVFMMVKFAPGFFGASGSQSDVDYISVFKFLDICSGFTSIKTFGAAIDKQYMETTPQVTTEYGENYSIFNLNGGGLSLAGRALITENIAVATVTPYSSPVTYYGRTVQSVNLDSNDSLYAAHGNDVNRVYPGVAGGEWFGLEIISDIGTPNNNDGSTELWVYDKNGNIKGHYSATGQPKLVHFDHYYNKITLGGNRRTGSTTSNVDGRYWVDDFIIHSSRIGPTYFKLFVPESRIVAPAANQQLKGAATVTAEVSDDTAVTRAELYVDGTKVAADLSTSTGEFTTSTRSFGFNTSLFANGVHSLSVKAYDAEGNVGTSSPVSVIVNNPLVTSFAAPRYANTNTIGGLAFTAADYYGSAGITGYLVTESSSPPTYDGAGWSATPPASYTVSSTGSHILYPWVKDSQGNVSPLYTSPSTVLVDTSAPVVSGFTVPSFSSSLDVLGITISGSDGAGGSGIAWYLVSESPIPPLPDAAGWSSSNPMLYKVYGPGKFTLYPWVKDAAGNVSSLWDAPRSVEVVPTLSLVIDAPRATTKSMLLLGGTVLNSVGDTTVSVQLGGDVIWEQLLPGNTWSTTVADLLPGENHLLVTARNAGEQSSTSITVIGGAGDLDNDGQLNLSDALLALKISVGKLTPTQAQLKAGDLAPLLNGRPSALKGAVTAADALVILDLIVGSADF